MATHEQSLEVGTGVSCHQDGYRAGMEAARQAKASIVTHACSVVIVYTSPHYDLAAALRGIVEVVGDAVIIGTTTSGEICNGAYSNSLVITILASPYLTVRYGIGRNASADLERAVQEAIQSSAIQPYFQLSGKRWQTLTGQGASAFGLLFSPGNTKYADSRSYEILELLKLKSFGQLPIVGGSSADNGILEKNHVLAGGEVFEDSILIAIFETKLQFGIALSHGFSVTPRHATITSVDACEVLTLDGKPAADVLSVLMKSSREELTGKHITFVTHAAIGMSDPMGQYSVVIGTYLTARGGVRFTQPLPVGAKLTVLEAHADSMVQAGPDVLRKTILRGAIEHPGIALVNYCALRPRLMGQAYANREIAEMAEMLGGAPLAGFFSYGEQGVADDGVSRQNNVAISALTLGLDLSQAAKVAIENERLHAEVTRNARLLAERNALLQSEIADRSRTEQALRQSEEALRQSRDRLEDEVCRRTRELVAKNAELAEANRSIEKISLTDPLTGIRNRRFLDQHLDADLALATRRYQDWLAQETGIPPGEFDAIFFMIDVDHFKSINDLYGHNAGDQFLLQLCDRLREVFRESDYLVRWGGEEFVVVARAMNRDKAEFLAERIRAAVANQDFDLGNGQRHGIRCSVGFACYPFFTAQPELVHWRDVIKLADLALYAAKRGGRNAWAGYYATATPHPERWIRHALYEPEQAVRDGTLRLVSSFAEQVDAERLASG